MRAATRRNPALREGFVSVQPIVRGSHIFLGRYEIGANNTWAATELHKWAKTGESCNNVGKRNNVGTAGQGDMIEID
jgi:hypothetical protein